MNTRAFPSTRGSQFFLTRVNPIPPLEVNKSHSTVCKQLIDVSSTGLLPAFVFVNKQVDAGNCIFLISANNA